MISSSKMLMKSFLERLWMLCLLSQKLLTANGEKKLFKRGGLGRNRAKKFLTQVGLNGLYETFRLDEDTSLKVKAIGGAVSIDFERMMDGAETLSEFMAVLTEASRG